jgi:RNA-directed DNA polymerase
LDEKGYFQIAETPRVLADIDKWIRHRLRALQLKYWKRGPIKDNAQLEAGAVYAAIDMPWAKLVGSRSRRPTAN